MKKRLLLLLTCVLTLFGVCYAGTASFNWSDIFSTVTSNKAVGTDAYTSSGVSITFSQGSGSTPPTYYNSGTAIRWYYGNTMTITSDSEVTKIELKFNTGGDNNTYSADTGSLSNNTWTGSSNKVVFTVGQNGNKNSGNIRLASVTVTYADGGSTVSAPEITCTNNLVTISCSSNNSKIYYTINGSNPTSSSTAYTSPFSITANTTVKAIAYVGTIASEITTKECTYTGSSTGGETTGGNTKTDELTNSNTIKSTTNTYTSWTYKDTPSGAVYSGYSAGTNSSIQLNNDAKGYGIVTTASGGKIKSVKVTFNTATTSGRQLDIYASNTAYTSPKDLYDNTTQGTKVTSFNYTSSSQAEFTYTFTDTYQYIGFVSNKSAMYIAKIEVEWEPYSVGPQPWESTFKESYDVAKGHEVELFGETDEHPEMTYSFEPNDGSIEIIRKSNTDSQEFIKGNKAGKVEVTAKWGDSDKWTKGEATFAVNVQNIEAPKTITFDPESGSTILTTDLITISANGTPAPTITYCFDNKNGTYTDYLEPIYAPSAGEHTLYVKAKNGEGEISAEANYTVVEPEKGLEDVLTSDADCFNMNGSTYTQYEYTSSDTGVKYSAKASLSNGIQIKSSTSGNNQYSGIASIENSDGFIISKIEISQKSDSKGIVNIQVGNFPCEVATKGQTTTNAYVKPMSSPVETSNFTSAQEEYVFVPEKKAKYFRIYTSNDYAAQLTSIKVTYKKVSTEPEPQLGELNYSISDGFEFDEDLSATVDVGTKFYFWADNATNIKLSIDEDPEIDLPQEEGKFVWTVNDVLESIVAVTPYMGTTQGETVEFMIFVNEPTPQLPIVSANGEALENKGKGVIAKGAEVTITAENAKSIIVMKDGEEVTQLTETPFKFIVNESGKYTFVGKNGENESEAFIYTFTVGEVDPNMPAVGSSFKQVLNGEDLEEGYYVIARTDRDNTSKELKSAPVAMSTSAGNGNIIATTNVSSEEIVTGRYYDKSNQPEMKFELLSNEADDVLIIKLEKNEQSQWGIKTVNFGDGYETSQGYLSAPSEDQTTLKIVEDFTPAYITFSTSNNVNIVFTDTPNEASKQRTIKFYSGANGNNYFNYQTGGTAIQLYKLTSAKVFDPGFEDQTLEPGDKYTVADKLPENAPVITYSKKDVGNTTIITLNEDGSIEANREAGGLTATVQADWNGDENWFFGNARFDVKVLLTPEMYFRHDHVIGKKNVGVLSQAVYYNGDGAVSYAIFETNPDNPEELVPTAEITINPETGMIRPADLTENVKIGKIYTVVATVEKTGNYAHASASYTLEIQESEANKEIEGQGTFDFVTARKVAEGENDRPYGMFPFSSFKNNFKDGNEEVYETTVPQHFDGAYSDYKPITHIIAEDNEYLTIDLTGRYRSWDGYILRTYSGATLTLSVQEGSLSEVEFTGGNKMNKMELAEGSIGTYKYSNQNKDALWSCDENSAPTSITFNISDQVEFAYITVKLNVPDTNGKPLADLYFDTSEQGVEKYVNMFEDEEVTLPELKHANDMKLSDVTFTIDQVEDETVGFSINDKDEDFDWDNIKVSVTDPGVYTLRAEYNGEDFLNGFAILRLNVFPHLNVLPNEDHDSSLAEDKRTENPNLTLVTPVLADDGSQTARIDLPSLDQFDDPLKYSTVTLSYVTVKHGKQEITYRALNEGEEESEVLKDINNIDHFDFTEDGSVTYYMLYANTEDFFMKATVHVVLMPQVFEVKETGDAYNLMGSNNSKIQYRFVGGTQKNVRRASEPDAEGWITAEGNMISVPTSDIPNSATALEYRSMKDIQGIVDRIEDVDDGKLYSEVKSIALEAQTVTVTVGTPDAVEWSQDGSYTFKGLVTIEGADNGEDYTDLFTIEIEPAWTGAEVKAEKTEFAPVWMYNQMVAILDAENEDNVVDGYLTAVPTVDLDKNTDLTVKTSCSGVYTVTFTAKSDDVQFAEGESSKKITVTVFPSFTQKYSYTLGETNFTDDGLNIDGAQVNVEGQTVELYEETNLAAATLYVPGVYFASIEYTAELKQGDVAGEADNTGTIENGGTMDLVNATSVNLVMTKNGASNTLKITLSQGTTTGVEGIGSEDGEAEYFDLNGFKVNADRLEKGIYIKVQNGTATKVLVK